MSSFLAAQPWSNFFVLMGEAAATLTGLMFVAVTFGASMVKPEHIETVRAFTDPIFAHFVHVIAIGAVMVFPSLNWTWAAVFVIGGALFRSMRVASVIKHVRLAHARAGDIEISDWVINVVVPSLLYLAMIGTGVAFARERPEAFTALAICCITQLVLGIYAAWEMLVWMATRKPDVEQKP